MPPIKIGNRYKVFIPSDVQRILNKVACSYHEKVITVLDVNKAAGIVLIAKELTKELNPKGLWVEDFWLFTLDPDGKCICGMERLIAQGCNCGGR
jgi:hypothetical protein